MLKQQKFALMEPEIKYLPNDLLLGEISQILSQGKDVQLMARGSSMLPFIVGDRDSVRMRRMETVAPGDIVLAEIRQGVYVLHRVVSIVGEEVTLMGDGNLRGCEKCRIGDIKGTVFEIVGRDNRVRKPAKGRLWKALKPIRRIMLAVIRRVI